METGRKTVTLEVLKTVKDFEDDKIGELKEDLADKQDKLTAGAGISIAEDGTISVSYSDGDEVSY